MYIHVPIYSLEFIVCLDFQCIQGSCKVGKSVMVVTHFMWSCCPLHYYIYMYLHVHTSLEFSAFLTLTSSAFKGHARMGGESGLSLPAHVVLYRNHYLFI